MKLIIKITRNLVAIIFSFTLGHFLATLALLSRFIFVESSSSSLKPFSALTNSNQSIHIKDNIKIGNYTLEVFGHLDFKKLSSKKFRFNFPPLSVKSKSRNTLSSQHLIDLTKEVNLISLKLLKTLNDEVGLDQIQAEVAFLPYTTLSFDLSQKVEQMVSNIELKIFAYTAILQNTTEFIKNLYKTHLNHQPISYTKPCCYKNFKYLKYDKHFGLRVDRTSSCEITSQLYKFGAFSPGNNLTQQFKVNLDTHPSIKWQYFFSILGVYSEYPAFHIEDQCSSPFDPEPQVSNEDDYEVQVERTNVDEVLERYWDIYPSTILPHNKFIVIILDHGSSINHHQFNISKEIAKVILHSLSYKDKVGFISLTSTAQSPHSDCCLSFQLAYATHETKLKFSRFIDDLSRVTKSTNHLLGFEKAFQMINETAQSLDNQKMTEVVIAYISRGIISFSQAKSIMQMLANQINSSKFNVIINTYPLIDEKRPVLYRTTFLQDIAKQNYSNYNVTPPKWDKIRTGLMVTINSLEHLTFAIQSIYSIIKKFSFQPIRFSLPFWDPISKDVHLSMSRSVTYRNKLIGVFGFDLLLNYLFEDVIHSKHSQDWYTFVIEKSTATVLFHPLLSYSWSARDHAMHTDIIHLEQHKGFSQVREAMLQNLKSNYTLKDENTNTFTTYHWMHVKNTSFILCLVASSNTWLKKSFTISNPTLPLPFIYHRLDLLSCNRCKNFKQLATLDKSTIFLSTQSFQSSYRFLIENETLKSIASYMAYFNDKTKLIMNPGFKSSIRSEIYLLAKFEHLWKRRALKSDLSKYIIRRFVASTSGVLAVYPGTLIDKSFDPSQRTWFQKALEFPSKIVLSAPYLDSGGSGYIITLSHATSKSKNVPFQGVVGIDFTIGYFYKLLNNLIPECGLDNLTCFIMNEMGYLITHPKLIEPAGRGPVEFTHITHNEALLANDLLYQQNFVQKKICNNFGDRTIQRYYQFNLSLDTVLTNLVQGDTKYQILAIPSSNLFIGVASRTRASVPFCPCSMYDRICMNCQRMVQTECECPCECPLEIDLCTGKLLDKEDLNPTCVPSFEDNKESFIDTQLLESLPDCFQVDCESKDTESDCVGVKRCEWCQLISNSNNTFKSLTKKFCTTQEKCFGGVLNARTPYSHEINESVGTSHPYLKNSPIGSLVIAILACFLVLTLSVYCYRYYAHRNFSTHYLLNIRQDLRMSHLENESEYESDGEIKSELGARNLIINLDNHRAVVSPYRLNSEYQRPPGGDSDFGYSTMTPNEDCQPPFVRPLFSSQNDQTSSIKSSLSACNQIKSSQCNDCPSTTFPQSLSKMPLKSECFLSQNQIPLVDSNTCFKSY